MASKSEVLETWYRRVWEEEDAGAIDELFVPDGCIEKIGMSVPIDIEEFKGFHKLICDQLKDIDIKIDMCIEQGDWLAALCSCYAKDAVTGNDVSISGNVLVKITDGKLRAVMRTGTLWVYGTRRDSFPERAFRNVFMGKNWPESYYIETGL